MIEKGDVPEDILDVAPRARKEIRASRILLHIAKEGPLNKYQVWKSFSNRELGTEPTILDAIRNLEESKRIEIKETKENARGPRPSKYYDLTSYGLMMLIIALNRAPHQIISLEQSELNALYRHLAKKYRDYYPCVFGLWQDIVNAGVEDLAQNRCFSLALAIRDYPDLYPADQHPHHLLSEQDPHLQIFLDPFEGTDPLDEEINEGDLERWGNFIGQHSSLRNLTAQILKDMLLEQLEKANKILVYITQPEFELVEAGEYAELLENLEAVRASLREDLSADADVPHE